jgi:SOS-response transcriptional repressor LexA
MPFAFSSLCADLLGAGQRVRFRVGGASMFPAICDGDTVTVAPVASEAIRPGDVVLYGNARGLTAHRVLGRSEATVAVFRMRGDAPGSEEERISRTQVLGLVVRLERNGRSVPLKAAPPSRLGRLRGRLATRLGAA